MLDNFRAFFSAILSPVARLLLRLHVKPDVVTFVGTLGVSASALWFYPQGLLGYGSLAITAFVFSDMLDGLMARMSGRTSTFGAFLDSTLDRIGDAAIFAGLILYFASPYVVGTDNPGLYQALTTYCLVSGMITSYARARAESLGFKASVGIAERADRLVLILFAAGLSDFLDMPKLLFGALWILAVASTSTVLQRIWAVYQQASAEAFPTEPPPRKKRHKTKSK
jgi:CDP-diacylglycerol---glycerol-3-phosphate 3-phosphatidyltransferase